MPRGRGAEMKKYVLWDYPENITKVRELAAALKKDISIEYIWVDREPAAEKTEGAAHITFEELAQLWKDGGFEGVILSGYKGNPSYPNNIWARAARVKGLGIADIYVIPSTLEQMPLDEMSEIDKENVFSRLENFSEPTVIKFLASEACNLNCSGCTHFVPLNKNPHMLGKDELQRYLLQLKKIFRYIRSVEFLGGEPLLNPDLADLIQLTHAVLPYTRMAIITNGLLIPKMSQDLLHTLRLYDVSVFISNYKPTVQINTQIRNLLSEYGIWHVFSQEIDRFRLQYNSTGCKDMDTSFRNCLDRLCHTCVDGKLAGCYYAATVKHANEFFGLHIPYEEYVYDIFHPGCSGVELLHKLTHATPLCQYCNSFPCPSVPWRTVDKSIRLEDWFSDEVPAARQNNI